MVVKGTYLGKIAKDQGWADVSAMLERPDSSLSPARAT